MIYRYNNNNNNNNNSNNNSLLISLSQPKRLNYKDG